MDKFLKSFTTIKGDNVQMNIPEMLMYGLIPGFGQLLMRIDKFGGSLDKPYLLFPLLLFPPFSFIPVLAAKFGFLNKVDGGKILDIYVLIPIIFRFILILVMAQIGLPGGILLQVGLIFAAIFITNIIRVLTEERCKLPSGVSGNFGNKLLKEMADSMVEYAAGILVLFSTEFIPIIGGILGGLRQLQLPVIGDISQIIDASIWSIGLVCGYMIMKMIDANYYSVDEVCAGKIGLIRIIVSIIAFAMAVFSQLRGQIMNIVTSAI
jgi:hypothetical protein